MLFISNSMNRGRYNSPTGTSKKKQEKIQRNRSQKVLTKKQSNETQQAEVNLNIKSKIENEAEQFYSDYLKQLKDSNMSLKQVKDLHQMFVQFDKQNKKYLEFPQFQQFLQKTGYKLNVTTIQGIFKQIKQLSKPGVYFDDLIQLLRVKDYSADTVPDMLSVFAVYDKKKRGEFDFQDYCAVSRNLKHKFPKQVMKKAFQNMDSNSDGLVTFEEFKAAMQYQK